MTNTPQSDNAQLLIDLLSSSDPRHGLLQSFPQTDARLSIQQALASDQVAATPELLQSGSELAHALDGLIGQLTTFREISRCPILAVTGLLNSGKSSLIATYLSAKNRARVLRGLGNNSGTHRFVLWLPKVWWDNPDLLSTMTGFLTNVFGRRPELLSEDPEEAALQYNGSMLAQWVVQHAGPTDSHSVHSESSEGHAAPGSSNALNVPLIAYDECLDDLKLGLADCPDIQTGFYSYAGSSSTGQVLAQERRLQLARMGRLCSAFVVVCKLNSLHDDGLLDILTTLRDAMPSVPRLLAINKLKARYAPATVLEQAQGLKDRFGISEIFTAYDFRSALATSRLPGRPPGMPVQDQENEDLPVFFAARAETLPSAEPLYLYDLGKRLDIGALSYESSRSLQLQLKTKTLESLAWLDKNQRQQALQSADAWQAVADACYEFMAERDSSGRTTGLRLQASPAIVAQMADSLQKTAPAWMRLSLSIDRTARQLHQAVANSASRFKILQSASQSVTQLTKRFRRGEGAQVVTPQRLAQAMRAADKHDALFRLNDEQLTNCCEQAMKRFAAEDTTRLDAQQLDEWSKQVWQGMSFKDKLWKGTQPLAVLMAPLLAAVLIPIDAGGTAVLVFASTKELFAAAGIAVLTTSVATGGETLSIVQRETPWRQLSDLFAIACDSLRLPRPELAELPSTNIHGSNRRLLASNLESKSIPDVVAFNQWALDDTFLRSLRSTLQHLG